MKTERDVPQMNDLPRSVAIMAAGRHATGASGTSGRGHGRNWGEGTEFSSQLVFSVLGQTETGPFPELIDDLIKAVKIYLCIKPVHPNSGQRAQSVLSRPREILPTHTTSVLLLNSLVKVIKIFSDKRKV